MMNYDEQRESPALETIRSLLPVMLLGIFVALVALLILQWPVPTAPLTAAQTDHQVNRMIGYLSGSDASLPGFLLDVAVYVLLLAGLACIVMAWMRVRRGPLVALTLIGVLGLAYVAGSALYTGPMIGVCGFTLVLFGALVAWFTLPDKDETEKTKRTESVDAVPATEPEAEVKEVSETSDYASHSVT